MSRDRSASAEVCAACLYDPEHTTAPPGSVLIAGDGDDAPIAREVEDAGGVPTIWHRLAIGGRPASAWPPEGLFDAAVLRLPRGREHLQLLLATVAARLTPSGALWLHGLNDEGIKSAQSTLLEVFGVVESVAARRHGRVWRATARRDALKPPAPTVVREEVAGVALAWESWPGLFAHGRLDPATRALLECLPTLEGPVLDYGCGAGVIAQFLQRRDGVVPDLVDVDALAMAAAARNVPGARLFLRDDLPPESGRYRAIVSNPPLHQGHDEDPGPLRSLIAAAPRRLGRSGELWITTQGAVPLRAQLEQHFPKVRLVQRDQRFTVWCAAR